MMYDLYIEKQRADINQTLSIQLSYAIDDIRQFGSRNTSFSKSITLPGTARNNKLFGHVLTNTGANPYSVSTANIDINFNPADISLCEVRSRGLLVLKGIFRLTGYKLTNGVYEYEGTIFGELGGFVSAIGNSRLEDLDFSAYDHIYNASNIVASWDNAGGSGYYHPLIDYGTYSTDKDNYSYLTFRPALYVKEYIDKIFENSGYTYESSYLNASFFKSLIIPHNQKQILAQSDYSLEGTRSTPANSTLRIVNLSMEVTSLSADWTENLNKDLFTYTGSTPATFTLTFSGDFTLSSETNAGWAFQVIKSNNLFYEAGLGDDGSYTYTDSLSIYVTNGDTIRLRIVYLNSGESVSATYNNLLFRLFNAANQLVAITLGDTIEMYSVIPKGIFQKDFFTWILRMFNLYVTEDKLTDKHLIIEPYIDYYDYTTRLDWSQKIDYSKTLSFEPMGQLNGRFFEYKYQPDNDFYNEGYQKKFNQSYGDILYDTGFPFSKDRQTVEIGFSPTPLVMYTGTDKIVPAIYKKSKGNDVDQEELTDSNIRILIAKKITGVSSWDILNGAVVLSSQTTYGYAGHLDDPETPTVDLNFGAPSEIYFTVSSYPGDNLFNVYWNSYIQEITNKDSKILSCHAYLKQNDIADLDFSKPIYISGSLWRINKIEDYDAENPVTRVELLKIINADNG